MNQKIISAILLSLSLSACTTTQQAEESLSTTYVGSNTDKFFVENGPPYKSYNLNNSDIVHLWNSGVQEYNLGTTTTYNGSVSRYGYYNGTATTTGGGTIKVFCEVQILAKEDGTIKSIKPVKDTIGNWQLSRCAEIFKNK